MTGLPVVLRTFLLRRSLTALKETYGAEAVAEAGLAILEQAFPAYSRPALSEMLEAAGGDVPTALDSMSTLETEHSRDRSATRTSQPQVIGYLPSKLEFLSSLPQQLDKAGHIYHTPLENCGLAKNGSHEWH